MAPIAQMEKRENQNRRLVGSEQGRNQSSKRTIDSTRPCLHEIPCMKTITVHVSEKVYSDFQQFAKRADRKASELIRDAIELYRQQHMQRRTSLRDRKPTSVGGPIQPVSAEDDLLGEMIHDARR